MAFVPISFDLNRFSQCKIHKLFYQGISNEEEYFYLKKKYGKNEIELKHQSFFSIFFQQLLHPFYLYQLFSIAVWVYIEFYYACIIIVFLMFSVNLIKTNQTYKNLLRILSFSVNLKTRIVRNFKFKCLNDNLNLTTNSLFIVPGDIIEIKSGEIIPCDAILLDGNLILT